MSQRQIIVIGAGPAGLLAALAAAAAGARVTVCEKSANPGLKLLASGGGRCNLSNLAPVETFLERYGRQGRFAAPALEALPPPALRAFCERLGVPLTAPDGLHLYPASQRAGDLLAAWLAEGRRLGVTLQCGVCVQELLQSGGRIAGVRSESGSQPADAVVLASGGLGYPQLGGSELGYRLAEACGHTLVPLRPGLVGLHVAEAWIAACQGTALPAAELRFELPRRRHYQATGELLFTHRGLSGPLILDASAELTSRLADGEPPQLRVRPALPPRPWPELYAEWRQQHGARRLHNLLAAHLPHRLAEALARLAGLPLETTAANCPREGRDRLLALLSEGLPFTVTGSEGFAKAMVTRGGVALKEVDPRTLGSRLLPGLYCAGEVLDLDGPCGGFNLQWACASGWLAGRSAALGEPAP